jgi:hypothetical protein
MPAATQAVYDGEEVTMQAGYNTATLLATAGSEAYDEPLTTLSCKYCQPVYCVISIYPA